MPNQPDSRPRQPSLERRARPWAETVLAVLDTRHPWASGHVSRDADDCDVTPAHLHPAFHGSFDWHSSVHMQWSAVRLLGEASEHLGVALADQLRSLLDERLTEENGRTEAAYLRQHRSWERPYGWAWAAMLAAEVHESGQEGADRWRGATAPLVDVVGELLLAWLPRMVRPVRHGVHSNTAFALVLCHEAFGRLGREDVVAEVARHAVEWYAEDRDYPSAWEPSGEDFLSPALCEAELMRRVLPDGAFEPWLAGFLPALATEGDPLLGVPEVRDRADGKSVHLFGLALSRAWLLRSLAPHLPGDRRARATRAASEQASSVEREIVAGDLMATHWLVSFALLAEEAAGPEGGAGGVA